MALFVFWIFLSASFEWIHLVLGLTFSLAVAWINSGHSLFVPKFRLWLRILLYLPWLSYKIVESSVHLSKLILHPALPIAPQLISVDSKLRHHGAIVLLGNSITLTPGTITAEVDRNKLVVHAIDKVSSEDVASRQMEMKIADIFKDEEPDL
ncbi:MAG: Na+/H+ antiporter subunit E [Nitrospinaceae bacterium]|nr:MAG: Na+/H+ antiporter subunit E [Nitrospinaceae bacterium]